MWLDTQNLFTKKLYWKLENCRADLYPVKKVISTHAIELDLPKDLRIHLVFYVNLLEPTATDKPHTGHIQPSPSPIKVDGEVEWEVAAVVDSYYFGCTKKLQYRVQWVGYDELNWEDATNVTNALDVLNNFHTRYPMKPGPHGLAGARHG